jgi:hypothetical protein
MASIIRTDALQNLNTSNIISQTNSTTITVGAAGQTVAMPGSVNLPTGSVGISQLSATGSPSDSTYLRGDNTWGAISSSPATLKSNITLKTAASVTAGKLASINSSGEIINLPTLNTYGTVRTNSSNTGGTVYSQVSLNGSTALSVINTNAGGATARATFYGAAISNSATPTNGATTTNDIGMSVYSNGMQYGTDIYPIGNNTFMVMQYCNGYRGGCCTQGTQFNASYYIITVDASTGNLTKGAVVTSNQNWPVNNFGLSFWYTGQINKDILINYAAGGNSSLYKNFIVTWSGTTVTITTDTTDVPFWYQANGVNSLLTSSNILCLGVPSSATWRTASWTASPQAIGTKTDTTVVADYLSGGTWHKMDAYSATGASYVLFTYTNTSNNYAYNTFSINQTTGALTSVEAASGVTATQRLGGTITYSQFKNSSSQVNNTGATFNSIAWTNGAWQNVNASGYSTVPYYSQFRLNSGDLWYLFSYSNLSYPTNIGYTVNAYGTEAFNYIGVIETTTSSSPASIVTNGIAANFTSLTAGNVYYATSPYDGTVATSTASGILVGKAISSTQILLQRSNTQ